MNLHSRNCSLPRWKRCQQNFRVARTTNQLAHVTTPTAVFAVELFWNCHENQHKFIAENWKGTLYAPSGKQQNFRIYVLDAEVAIRNQQTVENLKKLAQFKTEK